MAVHDPGSLLGGLLGQGRDDAATGRVLGDLLSAVGQAQDGGGTHPLCGLLDVLARSGPPSAPPAPPPEPPADSGGGTARLSGRAASTRRTGAD
ncbi:hypothetical protein [Streptomyces sp. NPDC001508]|uniref:hypothetical protein n=1 Tax=Streptomyces sp. NPDC001508 TaxID=3154656 RepID=UPI00331CD815